MELTNIKKSNYNIFIAKENEKDLIFNSFSGAFALMDEESQFLYNNIENIDYDKLSSNEKKIIDLMIKNGFLIDFNLDEFKTMQLKANIKRYALDNKTKYFTIAPTLKCNMNCFYCFEKNAKEIDGMNTVVIESLIKFIDKETNGIDNLIISWYGGEPLLESETILKLSDAFIEICKSKNIHYKATMTTNGTLLDKETAKMLKSVCKIEHVQITLDGCKEIHDKRRSLKNNLSSFDTIIKNIEDAQEYIDISIRVNIDKFNYLEAKKLIDCIYEHKKWVNKVAMYFAPVEDFPNSCTSCNSCFNMNEFGKVINPVLNYLYEKGGFKSIKQLIPRNRTLCCSNIAISNFVIDPNGDLYKCWNSVGDDSEVIGNIVEGQKFNYRNIEWLSINTPKECTDCNILPMCQGGCAYTRLNNGNKPACNKDSVTFKENLKLVYDQHKKVY